MTVKELIDRLNEMDPNCMVVVSGYEGGVNEVTEASAVKIELNVNDEWYYGKHEVRDTGDVNAVSIC